jgi:hypothetical protein
MDQSEKTQELERQFITVPVNAELQQLIRSVSAEWQVSETEAVEELLFFVLHLRRMILAGTGNEPQKTEQKTIAKALPHEVVKSKFDRIGVITALAFGLGALLAVLYVLLTKR